MGIIDDEGKLMLMQEYQSIEMLYKNLYVCKKNNTLYLYNIKTKHLKKL